MSNVYPAGPQAPPAELTAPTGEYKLHVAVMLISIAAFVSVYLAMVGGAAWVMWRAYAAMATSSDDVVLWVIAGVFALFLFIFMVKGLFKRNRMDLSGMLEVTEADEPELLSFLHRLCEETGAPFPKHVYLSHDVNAAVFYDSSFLSLFWPVRKNLLIGLGLVNALNLTELKAVLGHELGHFAQSSMRLGSYVYVTNQMLHDMIWSRDAWDRFIDGGTRIDIRIAIFFWLLKAVVWLLRGFLGLLFRAINFIHSALSREMEFAADRVAVQVAGSDALVHALLKLEFADACMSQTQSDMVMTSDHQLFTDDMYHHHERSPEYLRRTEHRPDWGVPPALPANPREWVMLFEAEEFSAPAMWASHPSDHDRELSAKEIYIRTHFDERSAWSLFSDPAALRKRMTAHVMRLAKGAVALTDAQQVQQFIDSERAETTFDARYRRMYDDRLVDPGDLEAAFAAVRSGPADRDTIAAAYDTLYGAPLIAAMDRIGELRKDVERLGNFLSGAGGKTLAFRGQRLRSEEAEMALEGIGDELEQLHRQLADTDARVLWTYAQMALALDDGCASELGWRYRTQLALQEMFEGVGAAQREVQPALELLSQGRDLSEDEVHSIYVAFQSSHQRVVAILNRAGGIDLPELANIEEGQFDLVSGGLIADDPLYVQSLNGDWVSAFVEQLAESRDKLRRLHFKSLGRLIKLQEGIAERWLGLETVDAHDVGA